MQNFISADWVYPVSSEPIQNGTLAITADGEILQILTPAQLATAGIKNVVHYKGALVPGLINTHCHLELSHLQAVIDEKTGLPGFIKQILAQRQQAEAKIIAAMETADQQMFENGIVAVGDIANLQISKTVKSKSKIYYHTFVEVFGFNRPSAPIIADGLALKAAFTPLKASIVPHAPYSVAASLFEEINKVTSADDIQSIHNQETQGETDLFETGTGQFADFLADAGIAQSEAHNVGSNSMAYHLPKMPKNVNTLLVHNTMSTKTDIDFAKNEHQKLYWCLCPNANLYIEDQLPNVGLFKNENLKITLGTDSLASNHQLNILQEMYTLQDRLDIPFKESLVWATLNGAEFLGINAQYGSLEIGKRPGIVLLGLGADGLIDTETTIKRLF